ncbi:hypothetical protein PQR34_18590 [Paraburkholderia sediminicola]|jgi:hypothetical protein|uniref:glycosyltransferase family 9 protein n=1 Tax=Paraburkholderia sediminicola TaxID=458836 RepID=UPI0038BB5540
MPTNLLSAHFPVVFAYNGGIGDRLCNLPALRALVSLFPKRLALVCHKGDRERYYSDLNLRAVYEIELERIDSGWLFDAAALGHCMGICDLLLCVNPWHTGSVSELLARFPNAESVGFFSDFRHHLSCDYYGHAIDMAFAVPAYLSKRLRLIDFSQPLAISRVASAIARDFRQRCVGSQRTLFVHMDTKREKCWARERFEHVLHRFLREFPDFSALVVDHHVDAVEHTGFPSRLLPVRLPLDASFGVLRDSDLFLGIDSCHLHAADLFRVQGVGLFGPTTCHRWGFKFSNHQHIQGRNGSMDTIEVDEVCDALFRLARSYMLNKPPRRES